MSEPISLDFGSCRALVSGNIPGLGVALIPEILALEDAERMAPAEVLLDLGDLLQWCDLVGYALALEGEVLRRAEGAQGYVWAVIRAEEDLDSTAAMVLDGVPEDDIRRWGGSAARPRPCRRTPRARHPRAPLARGGDPLVKG